MEIFCCTVVSQGNRIYAYIKINKIYFRKKLRTRIPIKTIKKVFYFNLDQVLFVWNMNIIQNKNNSYRLMIYQLHCIFIFIEKIIMHTCIFFPLKCTEFITKYTDFTQHESQFKGSKILKTYMIWELNYRSFVPVTASVCGVQGDSLTACPCRIFFASLMIGSALVRSL